jgi:hypothetical protein
MRMWLASRAATITAALVLGATSAQAASPFDGLWVQQLDTQAGQAGFDKYLMANGIYECDSCMPPRRYPADGKMRPVAGAHTPISESVRITGPRSMVTRIVEPDMVRVTTMTVAHGGQSATYVSLDEWPGRPKLLRTVYVAKRVAPAPPGAQAVSGSWRGLRYVEVPVEYRSFQLDESDGQFSRSSFRYGHYTARIGGPVVRVIGDGGKVIMARIAAPGPRTRVETLLMDGKPVEETTYRLSADGKSLVSSVRNPRDGSVFTTTSHRN